MRLLHCIILLLGLGVGLAGCGEPPKPTVNLYRAVHVGDLDQIKRHLFWGTDVNQPGPDGAFPLHVAVAQGRVAIAKELLKHGAHTDVRDTLGRTPLHVALADGKVPVARLLLDQGADDDLQTLLFELTQNESPDRDTLEFLIQNGVDINARGPDGMTSIHAAVASGDVQLTKRLLTAGADVNQVDASGASPLSLARALDNPTTAAIMAELLRKYGATN
jgi:ankyrin repeat protein